jgi:flagella basal body P-ring formation protein FlgA
MRHLPNQLHKLLFTALLAVGMLWAAGTAWADVIVTPNMIEAQVKEYLQDFTPLEDSEATLYVECVRLPFEPITLNGEHVKFLFEDNRSNPLIFRTVLQVTMSTEAESRQIGIPVKIMVEKPVWVATHLIRAREALTAKDVMLQRKQMDYEAAYSLGAKDPITSYTSRVNIEPGSILDVRKLTETPAVYRNDDVHVIMSIGNGVNVNVYAKALEDGAVGKRIRVNQRLANGKNRIYMAEVIGRNTVIVKM